MRALPVVAALALLAMVAMVPSAVAHEGTCNWMPSDAAGTVKQIEGCVAHCVVDHALAPTDLPHGCRFVD